MGTRWHERIVAGLGRTRDRVTAQLRSAFARGPRLDEELWERLEEALIGADVGITTTTEIIDAMRSRAARSALTEPDQVIDALAQSIAAEFPRGRDPFDVNPSTVVVVGVNGSGKTTSVAKIAKQMADAGRRVLLGSADTFRAAAAEQLDVLAERAGVAVVRRDRGADPASVAFDALKRAELDGADLVIIDTAGRLHTSSDLMRELAKVVRVTRERSIAPVSVVLVIDATTGQNGLVQARRFDEALDLDALIVTKLDGTARGGIALAASRELGVPIVRIGVGEGIDDLAPFDPLEFARALVSGA